MNLLLRCSIIFHIVLLAFTCSSIACITDADGEITGYFDCCEGYYFKYNIWVNFGISSCKKCPIKSDCKVGVTMYTCKAGYVDIVGINSVEDCLPLCPLNQHYELTSDNVSVDCTCDSGYNLNDDNTCVDLTLNESPTACQGNEHINDSGICVCDDNYYKLEEGFCEPCVKGVSAEGKHPCCEGYYLHPYYLDDIDTLCIDVSCYPNGVGICPGGYTHLTCPDGYNVDMFHCLSTLSPIIEPSYSPGFTCLPKEHLNDSGICVCDDNYYKLEGGLCEPCVKDDSAEGKHPCCEGYYIDPNWGKTNPDTHCTTESCYPDGVGICPGGYTYLTCPEGYWEKYQQCFRECNPDTEIENDFEGCVCAVGYVLDAMNVCVKDVIPTGSPSSSPSLVPTPQPSVDPFKNVVFYQIYFPGLTLCLQRDLTTESSIGSVACDDKQVSSDINKWWYSENSPSNSIVIKSADGIYQLGMDSPSLVYTRIDAGSESTFWTQKFTNEVSPECNTIFGPCFNLTSGSMCVTNLLENTPPFMMRSCSFTVNIVSERKFKRFQFIESICDSGYYSLRTSGFLLGKQCGKCDVGYNCQGKLAPKLYCEAGTYSTVNNMPCIDCPTGFYCTGGTSKVICPSTTYYNGKNAKSEGYCIPCPEGSGNKCVNGVLNFDPTATPSSYIYNKYYILNRHSNVTCSSFDSTAIDGYLKYMTTVARSQVEWKECGYTNSFESKYSLLSIIDVTVKLVVNYETNKFYWTKEELYSELSPVINTDLKLFLRNYVGDKSGRFNSMTTSVTVTNDEPTFPSLQPTVFGQLSSSGTSTASAASTNTIIISTVVVGSILALAIILYFFRCFPPAFYPEKVLHNRKDKYDVFLTHDWGDVDSAGNYTNHLRVKYVNEELQKRGIKTWFDGDRMKGNVAMQMAEGIDQSTCVLVFVTARYQKKVAGDNAGDNCQLEFLYAEKKKTAKKMIAVVMERAMSKTDTWEGPIGLILAHQLYYSLTSDDEPAREHTIDEIVRRIQGIKAEVANTELPQATVAEIPQAVPVRAENAGSSELRLAV